MRALDLTSHFSAIPKLLIKDDKNNLNLDFWILYVSIDYAIFFWIL